MSWSRRKRQLRPRVSGAQLAALSLATPAITENAAAGTAVSEILGRTGGSTLSLADSAGGRFALSGVTLVAGAVATDHETAPGHFITLRETLAGHANSPRDTVLAVSVTNLFEAPALVPLSLSATDFVLGVPSSGTIVGTTSGSVVTAGGLPSGLGIDGAARTWTWSGVGMAGAEAVTLTETLPDSANSPRASIVPVTIAETSVTYLTADNGDRLTDDNLNPFILEAA